MQTGSGIQMYIVSLWHFLRQAVSLVLPRAGQIEDQKGALL